MTLTVNVGSTAEEIVGELMDLLPPGCLERGCSASAGKCLRQIIIVNNTSILTVTIVQLYLFTNLLCYVDILENKQQMFNHKL